MVEVPTAKHVEVWECLRLDPYSNERLWRVLEMDVETQWREGGRERGLR